MKKSVERERNDTDRGETEVLGQKPVTAPLRPKQISHGLNWDQSWVSRINPSYTSRFYDASHPFLRPLDVEPYYINIA
jgi:hypothetical protein